MAKLRLKVEAEYENIEKVLNKMPLAKELPLLSEIELAGTATFLHNFYNGAENILKQCLKDKNVIIERSDSWHKELLDQAFKNKIISDKTKTSLKKYLLFRHFFVNAYALDLYADRMDDLVKQIKAIYQQFKEEIDRFTEV